MDKLFTLLGKLHINCGVPNDKQAHFITGVIGALAISYWASFDLPISDAIITGLLSVSFLALAKEFWYDATNPNHTVDIWDWFASTMGAVFGASIIFLILIK